jgi:hypothetical protein
MGDVVRTKFPPAHAEDDVNLRPGGEVPWYLQESATNGGSPPSSSSARLPAAHAEDDVNLRPAGERAWYADRPESGDTYSAVAATPAPSTPSAQAQPAWYQRVCAWFGE